MAKCRSLIQENQELGKQISQGRVAQLEAEIALQRKFNQEIKAAQDGRYRGNHVTFVISLSHTHTHTIELSEFVFQLDEEIEGMQAVLLQLENQTKYAGSKPEFVQQAPLTSPTKTGGSSARERTARGTPNGPIDAHSTANGSSLSSKVVSRSQT